MSNATIERDEEQSFLDEFHPSAAYHCGRILAILQHMQHLATLDPLNTRVSLVNATYVDRYYSAASTRPRHTLVPIFRRALHRLKQIKSIGARADVEALLIRSHCAMKDFPKVLSLMEQADFQLGYFHQRPCLTMPDLRRRLPTLKGHPVKSSGERLIADVLFLNDILYEYEVEAPIPGSDKSLNPDFTVPIGDDVRLLIEYKGLTGDERYDRTWNWKAARYRNEFKARTFEDVEVDKQLSEWILLELVPEDLTSAKKAEKRIVEAVRTLQSLAAL